MYVIQSFDNNLQVHINEIKYEVGRMDLNVCST